MAKVVTIVAVAPRETSCNVNIRQCEKSRNTDSAAYYDRDLRWSCLLNFYPAAICSFSTDHGLLYDLMTHGSSAFAYLEREHSPWSRSWNSFSTEGGEVYVCLQLHLFDFLVSLRMHWSIALDAVWTLNAGHSAISLKLK